MKSLMQTVIFFIGLIYLVWPYSVRWDSVNNPTENVTVKFRDETEYKGTLWTDFQGMQNLRMADGRVLTFDQNSKKIGYMEFAAPDRGNDDSSLLVFKHWRVLLPLTVWCFLFAVPGLVQIAQSLSNQSRREGANEPQ